MKYDSRHEKRNKNRSVKVVECAWIIFFSHLSQFVCVCVEVYKYMCVRSRVNSACVRACVCACVCVVVCVHV